MQEQAEAHVMERMAAEGAGVETVSGDTNVEALAPRPHTRGSVVVGGTRNLPLICALGGADAASPILAFGIHKAR